MTCRTSGQQQACIYLKRQGSGLQKPVRLVSHTSSISTLPVGSIPVVALVAAFQAVARHLTLFVLTRVSFSFSAPTNTSIPTATPTAVSHPLSGPCLYHNDSNSFPTPTSILCLTTHPSLLPVHEFNTFPSIPQARSPCPQCTLRLASCMCLGTLVLQNNVRVAQFPGPRLSRNRRDHDRPSCAGLTSWSSLL